MAAAARASSPKRTTSSEKHFYFVLHFGSLAQLILIYVHHLLSLSRPFTNKVSTSMESLVEWGRQWLADSVRLVGKCSKPDYNEFKQIAFSTGMGMVTMGFVGFFVKLAHIPILMILSK